MKQILIAAALTLSLGTGVAFAQSGQGGYLGLNPGKDAPVAATTNVQTKTSGQGGYLGENPGADVKTAPATNWDAANTTRK
ncbi:MAG TPA: hypothetical protein VMB81_29910 [Candidatus Sulfotelmatobacter sp.]|nr:hypothetical protein [Candidatus Sulfotelmatobacter sp.]